MQKYLKSSAVNQSERGGTINRNASKFYRMSLLEVIAGSIDIFSQPGQRVPSKVTPEKKDPANEPAGRHLPAAPGSQLNPQGYHVSIHGAVINLGRTPRGKGYKKMSIKELLLNDDVNICYLIDSRRPRQ